MTKLLNSPAVLISLLVAPIAVFFVYFFALRYDIPWFDEYENIPYFLQQFVDANSVGKRFDALLKPNNEHRVLYARLVVYAQYLLTGGISFQGLMLWGNLGLVLIFYLLAQSTQSLNSETLRLSPSSLSVPDCQLSTGTPARCHCQLLLPLPLILFTAQNYLLTFTAIYTLQYLAIIMLVMLTFFVLALNKPGAFAGALGVGALATFSMGNGILLWPAGVAMLVVRRRWSWVGIWSVFGAICIWLYFRNYPVQQGNSEGFAYVLEHPLQTLAGFFIFAGSLFDLFPAWPVEQRAVLPLLAGVVLVGVLAWWLVRVVFRREPAGPRNASRSHFEVFLTGVILFLLANMALIAVFRIRFYFGMVLHSSYRTYALVLWAVGYLCLISLLKPQNRPHWVWALWGIFLSINILSYVTYVPEAIQRRKHMQGLAFNQQHNQIGLGGTRNSALAHWIVELDSTMHVRGWHTLPNPAITPDEQLLLRPLPTTGPITPVEIEQKPDYIVVSSTEPGYEVSRDAGIYVVFQSTNHTYVQFAEPNKPYKRNPFSRGPGWSSAMPTALVQPGHYTIGLFVTHPGKSDIQRTGHTILVE